MLHIAIGVFLGLLAFRLLPWLILSALGVGIAALALLTIAVLIGVCAAFGVADLAIAALAALLIGTLAACLLNGAPRARAPRRIPPPPDNNKDWRDYSLLDQFLGKSPQP